MSRRASPILLATGLLGMFAGCLSTTPDAPPPPPEPTLGTALAFAFPTGPGNMTSPFRLLPTTQPELGRIYLSGGSAAEAVALDPLRQELGRGSVPGGAYAVAAARHAGVGTVFLEAEPGPVVHVLQERNLQFTRLADTRPGYYVGNAVLHQGLLYALLLDPDGLDAHRLVKVEGDRIVDMALDPSVDRGLNRPALGSDGETLALCQRQATVLQMALLDNDGRLVEARVLDPVAAGASPCVSAQTEGLHAFAWRSTTGQTVLARFEGGQLATETIALGHVPEGVWVVQDVVYLLTTDADGWTNLLMESPEGAWESCRVQTDRRDEAMLYTDMGSAWIFSLPYSGETAQRLVGERLTTGACPSLMVTF